MTPLGGGVRIGGELDPIYSSAVKVLIKNFNLIPSMAIFVG